MKNLLLIISIIILLLIIKSNLLSQTPDTCLKMIYPNNFDVLTNQGTINPDSVRVDSCENLPTQWKIYAKRYYVLTFFYNYYPFDNALKSTDVKTVDEISNNHPSLKDKLLLFQNNYGKLFFKGLNVEQPDSVVIQDGGIIIFFEDYQNCDLIINYLKNQLDSLDGIYLSKRWGYPLTVEENYNFEYNIYIYPNPTNSILYIENPLNTKLNYKILNIQGMEIKLGETNKEINLKELPNGLYFLIINNSYFKKIIKIP